MARDFTYDIYDKLINSALGSGYEILPVREYLRRDDLPERYIIVRHDIDRKPGNALDVARIEADAGVSTTYYFRAIDKTFKPDIFSRIEDLGHEVGYHYEDVDAADGDLEAARQSFSSNLDAFREHVDVDTVSMHGNPLTPHDNRELWEATDPEAFDLLGEVYLSVDFTENIYFSDTNRTWYAEKTIVNDWPVGPSRKPEQVESTQDLIELIEDQRLPQLYLLTHPNRWAETYPEWVVETVKDQVTNLGKYGLYVARSLRGDGRQRVNYDRS